jgi:hypothetical protein
MRITTFFGVLLTFSVAGCFNPEIADGGFACDPNDPQPCPEGYFCRNLSGAFLCARGFASVGGGQDLGMSRGDGGGGVGGGGGGGAGDVDLAMPPGPADLATVPPDLSPPPNNCTTASLIINEVRTGSTTGAKDEWVEILNPCGNDLTVTGKLVYRADTASSADTSTLATLTARTIPAGGYFLIANSDYSGSKTPDLTPFASTSVGMADGGGGVGLRDSGNTLLASMGWGTAKNNFQQGSAASAEATGKSIARQPNGANTHHDSVDFKSSTPTPGAAN